jgi:hypothetical protein
LPTGLPGGGWRIGCANGEGRQPADGGVMQFGFSSEYVTSGTFWFTLSMSLLNAGLAQTKQRSGFNWWLISLIAGPIATLLLVVWPPGDSAR